MTQNGDSTIRNSGNNVFIQAYSGQGNNLIDNYGNSVTIAGGEYNDTIANQGSNVRINGNHGADAIGNYAGSQVTIDAGVGNDSVYNYSSQATVNAGSGDDYVENAEAQNVAIDAGNGNDSIYNSGSNVSINAGAGNDSVYNDRCWYCTINTGEGNDSVYNFGGDSCTINTGSGNDSVHNYYSSKCIIKTGDGDDSILSNGRNVSINAGNDDDVISLSGSSNLIEYAQGDGNDTIYRFNESDTLTITGGSYTTLERGSDVLVQVGEGSILLVGAKGKELNINRTTPPTIVTLTDDDDEFISELSNILIDGRGGNDFISNYGGSNCTIETGAGNDSVYNYNGSNFTINTGAGNDLISLGSDAQNNVIKYKVGDGDDVIYGYNGNTTILTSGSGTQLTFNGSDIIAKIGEGTIILKNASGISGIHFIREDIDTVPTEGDDFINNTVDGKTINALGGDDTIMNEGSNVSINAGAGNDSVYNQWGDYCTINTGDDDDTIIGDMAYSSVNGGVGDDSINIRSWKLMTIIGGMGNDYIYGENHEKAEIEGNGILYQYNSGDGFDTIENFSWNDTLQIGGGTGTYSSQASGEDIIVTVGEGDITLVGAASLSNVNIDGEEVSPYSWTLNGTTATYGTSKETLVTVEGVKSLDGLTIDTENKTVMVSKASLNATNITLSGESYTLAIADDVAAPVDTNAGWSAVSSGKATYTYASNTAGYTLAENKISYKKAVTANSFTISGIKSTSGIAVDGTTVTLNVANLNKKDVTISDGYNLALADDVAAPVETNASWSAVSSGKATYTYASNTAGYTLADNKVSYKKAVAAKSFTLSGIKSTSGIAVDGTTVTLKAANLNNADVTISDGYNLALADDVAAPVETNASWSAVSSGKATYTYASNTAGYTLADNKVSYKKAVAAKSFTLSGIKSTSGIAVDGTTVTLKAANLNKKAVTITDGFTLKLADNVAAPVDTTANWSAVSSGKATYTYASNTAGYTLADNKVSYTEAVAPKSFTISGIKSTSGIAVDDTTVTLKAANLNKKDVTISDGFTLKLADDVAAPVDTTASWSAVSSGKATYTYASNTAGYTLADNKVSYKKAVAAKSFTLSGIKSTSGIAVDDTTVTLKAANLNKKDVTISDGFTLKLADNVAAPVDTNASWSAVSSGKATYTYASNTAGYTLADNKVSYKKAVAAKSFTLSGIKSTSGIAVDDTTVTLKAANLNKKDVTISDGFTLKLADDVAAPVDTNASWSAVSSGKATYTYASNTAGYTLADNKISYKKAVAAKSFTLSGIKSTSGIAVDDTTVTLKAANLNKKDVTISDGFTLKLADDVAAPVETTAGWSAVSSGKATYTYASNTAGYTLVDNKVSYKKAVAAKSFTLSGIKSTSGIAVDDTTVTLKAANLNKKDVTISDGFTLKLADNVAAPVDTTASWSAVSSGKATYTYASNTAGYTLADNKVSYTEEVAPKSFTISGIKSTSGIAVDGTTVTLNAANLDKKDITISDSFTLNLDEDVKAPVETKAGWTLDNNATAIYKAASTKEGYKLEKNTISYVPMNGGEPLATVKGAKSIDELDVIKNIIKLNKSALKDNVTVSGDYNFDFASDYSSATITSSNASDTITTRGASLSISTDAGDDYITNSGKYVTITGGTGDDTISLESAAANNLIQYKLGDGNDSIIGFNKTSTLKIGNGTTDTYSSVKSDNGSDIIVTVGDGSITLIDAANLSKVNILGIEKKEDVLMITNRTNDKSLTGTAFDDEIYNRADKVTLKGGAGDDLLTTLRKTTGVKLYGEAGDDTLEAYNATKVLFSGGDGNDVIEGFSKDSTLKIGNGKTSTYSIEKVDDDVIVSVGDGNITLVGAASMWIDSLNSGYGGLQNIKSKFQPDYMIFTDEDASSATLDSHVKKANASARTKAIKITGNTLDNTIIGGASKDSLYGGDGDDTLDGGNGDDKLYGQAGNDSLFGGAGKDILSGGDNDDTLWGGTGNDTLTGGNGSDLFIFNSGKDTITDYVSGEDNISLGAAISSTAVSGDDAIVKIGKNVLTIKNANHKTVSFIDDSGEEFDITFGKKTLDNSSDSSYTADSGIDFVDASKRTTSIEITGNKLDNTISGGSGKDIIYGLNGADSLFGGKGNDKLYGGEEEDTLDGGAGNDTLKGDKGDDIFVYSGGKDIIADYAPGEDKISLSSAYSDVAIKGRNVVLTVGSGTLTIKNAVYENITFINAAGVESTEVFGGEKLTNSSNSKVVLDPTVEFANATERTKTITITGNDLNNSILGGSGKDVIYGEDGNDSLLGNAGADSLYGGDGDDTLIGGLGDDRLWGDDGADTFIYKAGDDKDIIYNFDEDDILNLEGIEIDDIIVDSTGSSKGKLVLNFDDANSITLSKYVTNTFNINGTHYVYKGTKFTKDE